MVISQALINAAHTLRLNGITSCAEDARVIMCSVLDCGKLYLTVHRDEELPSDAERRFSHLYKGVQSTNRLAILQIAVSLCRLNFMWIKTCLFQDPIPKFWLKRCLPCFRTVLQACSICARARRRCRVACKVYALIPCDGT